MRISLVPLMLVALLLTACSDGSDRPPPEPPPSITALQVEPPRATLDVGTSESFRAIAAYSDGSVADVTPRAAWNLDVDNGTLEVLSDPAQSGQFLVEGAIPGEETIRVSLDGRDGIAIVTVVDVALTSIDIEPMSAELLEDTEFSFTATGNYEDGRSQDITDEGEWTSANTAVASVTGAGMVRAESEGTTTISAVLDGVTGSAAVEVNPQVELDFIEVSPAEARMFLEGSRQFSALAHYTDGSMQNVTRNALWISSDTSVVAQDTTRKGLFLSRGEGSAEITAEYGGINNRGSAAVTVERAVVTHITISPRDAMVEVGKTRRYFTEASGSDGSFVSINQSDDQFYEVADPSIAQISNDPANKGILTALEPGTTTVTTTFTYEGEEFTDQGTLTVCAPDGC